MLLKPEFTFTPVFCISTCKSDGHVSLSESSLESVAFERVAQVMTETDKGLFDG